MMALLEGASVTFVMQAGKALTRQGMLEREGLRPNLEPR